MASSRRIRASRRCSPRSRPAYVTPSTRYPRTACATGSRPSSVRLPSRHGTPTRLARAGTCAMRLALSRWLTGWRRSSARKAVQYPPICSPLAWRGSVGKSISWVCGDRGMPNAQRRSACLQGGVRASSKCGGTTQWCLTPSWPALNGPNWPRTTSGFGAFLARGVRSGDYDWLRGLTSISDPPLLRP